MNCSTLAEPWKPGDKIPACATSMNYIECNQSQLCKLHCNAQGLRLCAHSWHRNVHRHTCTAAACLLADSTVKKTASLTSCDPPSPAPLWQLKHQDSFRGEVWCSEDDRWIPINFRRDQPRQSTHAQSSHLDQWPQLSKLELTKIVAYGSRGKNITPGRRPLSSNVQSDQCLQQFRPE